MAAASSACRRVAVSMSRADAVSTSVGSTGGSWTVTLRSPDDLEVRQARQHRLAADARVLERDRDLLVAAGELRRHHDPVAPPTVAHPVAVAELAFAGNDRTWRARGRCRGPKRAGRCASLEGLPFRSQVPARAEGLAVGRGPGPAAALPVR